MKKFACLLAVFMLFSCGDDQEETQVQEVSEVQQEVEIDKLDIVEKSFSDFENWSKDDVGAAVEAFKKSCPAIMKEKGPYMSGAKIKIPVQAYKDICTRVEMFKPEDYRKFLEDNFVPFAVTYGGKDIGKFTAYYEAQIHASRTRGPAYTVPIYSRPIDLLEVNIQDFDQTLPKKRLVGRLVGQKLIPYFTRKEIEDPKIRIRATPILWANNEIDVHIMQIQGSAQAILDDGTTVRVSYDDNNGHPFKGIGSILLENRVLAPGQTSMINIKNWLKRNVQQGREFMSMNPRYIFHRISYENGPIGAQGVVLTEGRSLAVDNEYIPLGSMLWLETTLPDKGKVGKLMVAQDVGSAIKGPIRGDYFWGSGGDEVLRQAGSMNAGGRYFILVPRNSEVGI